MNVNTLDVLQQLGFESDASVYSDDPGGFSFLFPNLKAHGIGLCRKVVSACDPVYRRGRIPSTISTICEIQFEMTREVESFEQGVAWITAKLYRHEQLIFGSGDTPWWWALGRAHDSGMGPGVSRVAGAINGIEN